jgi:hypothetical protein
MNPRIGIGMGETRPTAVVVDRGRIVWRSPITDHPTELGTLLASARSAVQRSRFRRIGVVAALGPSLSQVKRLGGLPPTRDPELVARILAANAGRFFARSSELAPPVAHLNGEWWGAAFNAAPIRGLQAACSSLGLRFDGCVPTVVALAQLSADGAVSWRDGQISATIQIANRTWTNIRRTQVTPGLVAAAPDLSPVLSREPAHADAVAAALCSLATPLLFRPQADARRHQSARRALLIVACFTALVAWFGSRGVSASLRAARDEHRLVAARQQAHRSEPIERELNDVMAKMKEIDGFLSSRRSTVSLIASLADALPDSTAVVTLRVDTGGGNATVLSKSAAALVPSIEATEPIERARISGAVTRENIGGIQLQRIAIRFRLRDRAGDSVRSGNP